MSISYLDGWLTLIEVVKVKATPTMAEGFPVVDSSKELEVDLQLQAVDSTRR